jgi:hypothetical protein
MKSPTPSLDKKISQLGPQSMIAISSDRQQQWDYIEFAGTSRGQIRGVWYDGA